MAATKRDGRRKKLWWGGVVVLAGALLVVPNLRVRVVSSVTCAGLRALRVGQDEREVLRLLGPPVDKRSGRTRLLWHYAPLKYPRFYLSGEVFGVTFEAGKVKEATIFTHAPGVRTHDLYHLPPENKDQPGFEFEGFVERFCQ